MQRQIIFLHRYPVNCPDIRPHSISADAALQRRSCRPCSGEQKLGIASHQLAICPDIYKHGQLRGLIQPCRQQPAYDIPAKIVRCRRKCIHIARQLKSQLFCPYKARMLRDRCKRRLKYRPGRQSQKQMDHRRIAANHHRAILILWDPSHFLTYPDQCVESLRRLLLQLLQMLRLVLRIKNTA